MVELIFWLVFVWFLFQIHRVDVEFFRCSGFVLNFAAVTAVNPGWEYRAENLGDIRYQDMPQLKNQ